MQQRKFNFVLYSEKQLSWETSTSIFIRICSTVAQKVTKARNLRFTGFIISQCITQA